MRSMARAHVLKHVDTACPYRKFPSWLSKNTMIEFQIDQSHLAKLSSLLNAIGQSIVQYCIMWTTKMKFTVLIIIVCASMDT